MTNEPKNPASTSVPSLSGVILPHEDGQRLDRWCKKHWPDVPHGLLQKSSRKGALRLDGARAHAAGRNGEDNSSEGSSSHALAAAVAVGAAAAWMPQEARVVRRRQPIRSAGCSARAEAA